MYRSPKIVRVNKPRRLKWILSVARIERRSAFKMLTGNSIGKISLRKSKHGCEDNIRICVKEIVVNV